MAIIPFHIVDAFADRPFTGNPAAIIPNASSLTEAEMLLITDELSMEAGFVLPPATPGADVRLRFFTNRLEANLSGHVIIAAFVSMADRGFFKPSPAGTIIRLETGAGILPVSLKLNDDGDTEISVELPTPRFGEPVPAEEVAAALNVDPVHLMLDDQGPLRVSCGFDQIIVPVSRREIIRGIFNDFAAIAELTNRRGAGGLTLICPETNNSQIDFHCRFFHPQMGFDEDIASGTSLAAAAAFVVDRQLIPITPQTIITTEQGHSLGRPTTARILVNKVNDTIANISLIATGAVVMRGSFHFTRKALSASY
ncbi:MAG: PhzF family phenazine biosynthesis protein [bacterium]|nr:PhzF family phenazine biosynthesis protein [bacterium]